MTESPTVNVDVKVASGAQEVVRLAATLLVFGGVGAIAWTVAHTGAAELAGSGLAIMLVTSVKLMWRRGLIALPERSGASSFEQTKTTMRTLTDEWSRWLASASAPAIVLIAVGYAVAFLLLRTVVIKALTVFSNPWVAGGAAAIAGAFVVMPSLVPSIAAAMRGRGGAPAAPVAPVTPTPAAPAAPVNPAPAPAPKRVIVRKKENNV